MSGAGLPSLSSLAAISCSRVQAFFPRDQATGYPKQVKLAPRLQGQPWCAFQLVTDTQGAGTQRSTSQHPPFRLRTDRGRQTFHAWLHAKRSAWNQENCAPTCARTYAGSYASLRSSEAGQVRTADHSAQVPRKLPRMTWYAETQNYECFYE